VLFLTSFYSMFGANSRGKISDPFFAFAHSPRLQAARLILFQLSSINLTVYLLEAELEIVIQDRRSDLLTFPPNQYFGYGKISISCTGEGDNFTRVFWNRTDVNGNIIVLNTTSLDHKSGGVWQAKLVYRPNPVNVSYIYKCIAENKCCPTEISDPLTISYNPTFSKFLENQDNKSHVLLSNLNILYLALL
jgi:hypothetical protein